MLVLPADQEAQMLIRVLLAAVCVAQDPAVLDTLEVGSVRAGVLTSNDPPVETAYLRRTHTQTEVIAKRYRVHVVQRGSYTLELRSLFFDGYLVLRGPDGRLIAENDDGPTGLDARIQVDGLAPGDYLVEVCAQHGDRGPFELELIPGAVREAFSGPQAEALRLADLERRVAFLEQERAGAPELATALNLLARNLHHRGRFEQASGLLERALEIRRAAWGEDHPLTAVVLGSLGQVACDAGDYVEAVDRFEAARAIYASCGLEDHLAATTTLSNLGVALRKQWRLADARACEERALATRERDLGPEHSATIQSRNRLALTLKWAEDYGAAERLYERALQDALEAHGEAHARTVECRFNLAVLHAQLGRIDLARPHLERLLDLADAVGLDPGAVGLLHARLGELCSQQGRFEEAQGHLERAVEALGRAAGPDHPETLRVLATLGAVQGFHLGRGQEAGRAFEQVLEALEGRVRRGELPRGHPDLAAALQDLAELRRLEGNLDEASALVEQALEILRETVGQHDLATANGEASLARVLHDAGELDQAASLFESALQTTADLLGREHPDSVRTAHELALVLADQEHWAAALEQLRSFPGPSAALVVRNLAAQSEQEDFRYLRTLRWQLETRLALAELADDEPARAEAYASLLAWKGQIGRVFASRRASTEGLTPDQRALLGSLRATQSALSALLLAVDVGDDPRARARDVRELRARRNALELEWRNALRQAPLEPAPELARLREGLPDGSVLLDFFVHRPYRPAVGRASGRGGWGEPVVGVWITRTDAERATHLVLGNASDLQQAVEAFLGGLHAVRGQPVDVEPETAAGLRALLWDPIVPHLDGVRLVLVSPDRFLGTLPLETLRTESGRYLIEDLAFVYLHDLDPLLRPRAQAAGARESLLAVGGVDYSPRPLGEELQRRALDAGPARADETPAGAAALRGSFTRFWGSLPHTALESRTVTELHASVWPRGRRLLLQEQEASEERLKQALAGFGTLHLATHGFFQPEGLVSIGTTDASWDEGSAGLRAEQEVLAGLHPGLLSGLVCAGANGPGQGGEDGFLTAEEVSWLDLGAADLVVLSACDTGLGLERSGEGLIGLRRAFHLAGTRTVISSLWAVQDESTGQLMTAFYFKLWREGRTVLEALREARLELLASNRRLHGGLGRPSTWGAFVLSGDWR